MKDCLNDSNKYFRTVFDKQVFESELALDDFWSVFELFRGDEKNEISKEKLTQFITEYSSYKKRNIRTKKRGADLIIKFCFALGFIQKSDTNKGEVKPRDKFKLTKFGSSYLELTKSTSDQIERKGQGLILESLLLLCKPFQIVVNSLFLENKVFIAGQQRFGLANILPSYEKWNPVRIHAFRQILTSEELGEIIYLDKDYLILEDYGKEKIRKIWHNLAYFEICRYSLLNNSFVLISIIEINKHLEKTLSIPKNEIYPILERLYISTHLEINKHMKKIISISLDEKYSEEMFLKISSLFA